MIRLSDRPFTPPDALAEFERAAAGAGAIVSFTGLVRPHAETGDVRVLHLQAYSPMTENGIAQAMETAHRKWGLIAAHVIHRIGDMTPGEPIVFVATAAGHRRPAFEAADFLMDYLKTEAIFWKKEITASGTHWIEPRTDDYRDRARWAEMEGN